MIKLRFSRLPKHRKFNYIPVYYNEEKEELHARVDDIKREMGESPTSTSDQVKDNIRRVYRTKYSDARSTQSKSSRNSNLRIAGIAILLTVISYKLWNSNILEIIFEQLKR